MNCKKKFDLLLTFEIIWLLRIECKYETTLLAFIIGIGFNQNIQMLENKILLRQDRKISIVKLKEILYVKAKGNYTTLFLSNGRIVECDVGFGEFLQLLNNDFFFKCNRSTAVQIDIIDSICLDEKKGNSEILNDQNYNLKHEIIFAKEALRSFRELTFKGEIRAFK